MSPSDDSDTSRTDSALGTSAAVVAKHLFSESLLDGSREMLDERTDGFWNEEKKKTFKEMSDVP